MNLDLDLDLVPSVVLDGIVNDDPTVDLGVRPRRLDHLRQHRHNAGQQIHAAVVVVWLDRTLRLHDVENGGTLHRRASSDRVVLRHVGTRRSASAPKEVPLGGRPQQC